MTDQQRAHIAADLANLGRGRPLSDRPGPPIGGITTKQAAELVHVPLRSVERAKQIPSALIQMHTSGPRQAPSSRAKPRPKSQERLRVEGRVARDQGSG